MKNLFFRSLRFLLEVMLTILLYKVIIVISVIWLGYCLYASKMIGGTIKDGIKVWINYLKAGIQMNKDFVMNGLGA